MAAKIASAASKSWRLPPPRSVNVPASATGALPETATSSTEIPSSRATRQTLREVSGAFLEPKSSYRVAQQMLGAAGLAVGEQVLRQRLRARGLLESGDAGRQMLVVRRTD